MGVSPVTLTVSDDVADFHVGVDRDGADAGDLHAVTLDRGEARQREGHTVSAGTQIDDLILPGAVVIAVRVFSINAVLAASTVTPGSTAPDASFATPASVA